LINSIKEKFKEFIKIRIEEYRLGLLERIIDFASTIVFIIIFASILSVSLIFLGFSLSYWFASLLNNTALGFLCTTGIFILLGILILLIRNPIFHLVARVIVKKITKKH